uniref:Uncharacterized protein n=1 Tax=Anguilla anguilla TaxID=7936 RepID=A0A0E9R9W9_ANGAN
MKVWRRTLECPENGTPVPCPCPVTVHCPGPGGTYRYALCSVHTSYLEIITSIAASRYSK